MMVSTTVMAWSAIAFGISFVVLFVGACNIDGGGIPGTSWLMVPGAIGLAGSVVVFLLGLGAYLLQPETIHFHF